MKRFNLTHQARADLQNIWEFIAQDSLDAADRVLDEFQHTFARLAAMPGIGHSRDDLTVRDILIIGVLHGRRNIPPILEER